MNTSSNVYVMGFAIGVCVVISAALAVTANWLKPTQDAAAEFDRQKNVMMAAGLVKADDSRLRPELEKLYKDRVEEFVVDTEAGTVAAGKTVADVAAMKSVADKLRYRVVAQSKDAAGKPESYILPISGKGLWSTIYGYIALEGDLTHVRGVTFYKHGETPGLGGEVENPEWTALWKGKSILDEQGHLVGIGVKKGRVDPTIPAEKAHKVDGLSGATITSNGVTKFVKNDLTAFEKYLTSLRSKRQ
ncbi:MAG: NADH:ubiquinone reductase (Na(+)-transporting) subunit C [Planctomycetota bacterium]